MQALRPREMLSFKHSGQALRQKSQSPCQGNKEEIHKQSNERLGLLHSRLQQEAEKIRKWKNATELEMQQKNHQIQTSQQLIEKQQKSLINAQLQNETLNSRIEEEMANQKEVQRKIHSTREMCNALKEHVHKVEHAVELGETDRRQLVEQNSQIQNQYVELLELLKSLENEQSLTIDSLTKKIEVKEDENKQLLAQLSELKATSETEISALNHELQELNTKLKKMTNTTMTQAERLTSLELEKKTLEVRVSNGESDIKLKEIELKSRDEELEKRKDELLNLTANIETLNGEVSQLKLTCNEAQRHIEELTTTHQLREKELENTCETLKAEIDKEKQRLDDLESQLKETENQKVLLEGQCSVLNEGLNATQCEKTNLESQLLQLHDKHEALAQNYSSLEIELSTCHQQISALVTQLTDKKNEREALKVKMESLLEGKDKEVEELIKKVVATENIFKKLEEEKQGLLLSLKEKEEVIESLSQKNVSLESTMTINDKEKSLQLKLIRDEIVHKDSIHQQLTREKDDLESESKKLSQKAKEAELLTIELKKEVEEKSKSITSYQSELMAVTSQAKTDKCEQEKEIKSLLMENEELQEKIRVLDQEMSTCKKKETESRAKMNALTEEMGITLGKYNAENARILEKKDKEIESLHEAKALEVKGKENMKQQIAKLEKEVKMLQQEKKDYTAEDNEQYQMEIESLKLQLKEREGEVKELLMAATALQYQLKTTTKHKSQESPSVSTTTTSKAGPPLKTPIKRPLSSIQNTISTSGSKPPQIRKGTKETQEKRNFRELYPELENETPSFKKPKTKPYTLTPSSGGGRGRKSTRGGRGSQKKQGTEMNTSCAWFDSDPVFGFPLDS